MATIAPAELKRKLDMSEHLVILDVREPFEYEDWHIPRSINIPVSRVMKSDLEIPKEPEIVTVCAHGIRSAAAVRYLNMAGFNARSLVGGMVGWNGVYDFLEISKEIVQVRRIGKGCLSYIAFSGNEAVVIDPTIDIDVYLDWAKEKGVKIIAAIDTHRHADHASGGRLMEKHGVPYYGPEECNARAVSDEISFGALKMKAMASPGHTPGSLVYKVGRFIFTGDTLFVDAVGRPDLGQSAEENAPVLYDSIQKLLAMPDETIVLPAHAEIESIEHDIPVKETIEELRELPILKKSKEEFLLWISGNRLAPENFEILKEYNTGKIVIDSLEEFRELEAGANRCAVR